MADCGPLIALSKLDQLGLLADLFRAIHIPQTVWAEATTGQTGADALRLSGWLAHHAVTSIATSSAAITVVPDAPEAAIAHLQAVLDSGESQAIYLAGQLQCVLLMDEKRGRTVAKRLGIPAVGVLGVLLSAKRQGFLAKIAPSLNALDGANYFLAPALKTQALALAGEDATTRPVKPPCPPRS